MVMVLPVLPMPEPSPYSEYIRPLFYELQQAFTNVVARQAQYQSDDVMPGDRYAILKFESYDRNPNYPKTSKVLCGINSRILRFVCVVRVGVEGGGKTELEAQTEADIVAAQEMLNLEHWRSDIKEQMSSPYGMFEDFQVRLPVDQGLSQRIKDPDTWIVNITAELELSIRFKSDENGRHIYPLNA